MDARPRRRHRHRTRTHSVRRAVRPPPQPARPDRDALPAEAQHPAVPARYPAPQYLSELQARRAPADTTPTGLSDQERDTISAQLRNPNAITITAGYASKAFVTDRTAGWAVLDAPIVLVCASGIGTIRELLSLLESAAMAGRALVITAPSIAKDVLATLEVNVIQQKLRLLAVTADKHTLATIAAHTGARPLDRGDLQAGYFPADQLGRCGRWVADHHRSWLLSAVAVLSDQTPTEATPE